MTNKDKILIMCQSMAACLIFLLSMLFCSFLRPFLSSFIADPVWLMVILSIFPGLLTLIILRNEGLVSLRQSFDFHVVKHSKAQVAQICLYSVLVILGLNTLMEFVDLTDNNAQNVSMLLGNPMGILALIFVAPVVEELVFRESTIGRMLRGGLSPWTAIIFSSLLFGVVHANPAQIPFASLMGILLGYLYYRTGTLALPLFLHVLNNTLAVLLVLICGEDASLLGMFGNDVIAILAASVSCVVGCLGVARSV